MSTKLDSPTGKETPSKSQAQAFVEYIIRKCDADNGTRAALRRADNPSTEYQSWDVLAGFHIDLASEGERLSHALVAADIARTNTSKNGPVKIGQAIARSYQDGQNDDQAKAKLRRLLACDSTSEASRILRPLLRLFESRGAGPLDYVALLNDLRWFNREESRARTKIRWAQSFYGHMTKEEENES